MPSYGGRQRKTLLLKHTSRVTATSQKEVEMLDVGGGYDDRKRSLGTLV